MRAIGRLVAMVGIFGVAAVAWLVLAGILSARTSDGRQALHGQVADLWGQPLEQRAPTLKLTWTEHRPHDEPVLDAHGNTVRGPDGQPQTRRVVKAHERFLMQGLASSDVTAQIALDQRRKGLLWFALYDVVFAARWTAVAERDGDLTFAFPFPVANGVYDDFRLEVDGVDVGHTLQPRGGAVHYTIPVTAGQEVRFAAGYTSRGLDSWVYRPVPLGEVGRLEDFRLTLTTDFADIDFPAFTLSPSDRERSDDGWILSWDFQRLVTGHGMGMVMPHNVQPGPLAAAMSATAPISLGLFMLWIQVLAILRGIDIHPVNHLFIAAAFFAFHLLFGYSADHLAVELAFGLSAVVSLVLVATYLRLVVGPRFALIEAGLAQLLYLVGFSLAHFWEGFTGLTLTVLGIVTLFALMQLTGPIRWSEFFARDPA